MASKDLENYKFVRKDYRWQTIIICPICKKERWVWKQYIRCSKNFTGRCKICNSRTMMRENSRSKIDIDRLLKDKKIIVHLERDKNGQLGTWIICPKCKKIRWVTESNIYNSSNFTKLCQSCNGRSGEENGSWKGGIVEANSKKKNYYLLQYVNKDSPYYSMVNSRGYVLQHRLIVAKKLGRPLKKHEVVHHINCIKNDNRPENLELLNTKYKHVLITKMESRIKELEQKLENLKINI
jgi:hypothetical protein